MICNHSRLFNFLKYVIMACCPQKPAEIIAIRSTVVKPIHPDSKGRCRIWDSKRLICLPNVFLLGASKTGTTSWFNYLIHHPNVTYVKRRTTSSRQASQEVHRFDNPWFHFYPKRVSCFVFVLSRITGGN